MTRDVRLYVEDSGPGISPKKQQELFSKYQESLDVLCQGTGIGLNLSKKLMLIMKGDLWLDPSYRSGVDGCPGSCFVIDLRTPPIEISETQSDTCSISDPPSNGCSSDNNKEFILSPRERMRNIEQQMRESKKLLSPSQIQQLQQVVVDDDGEDNNAKDTVSPTLDIENATMELQPTLPQAPMKTPTTPAASEESQQVLLPENISVLFVDDDSLLRKLFVRGVKRAAPSSWTIRDAASGEMAINLCCQQHNDMGQHYHFDIIFMDQYMASVDKQLLGTETVHVLREKGITSKICGLSANNLKDAFMKAGANHFILKPMPCKPNDMKQLLFKLLSS